MRHVIKAKVHAQGRSWLPVQGAQSATLALVDLLQIEAGKRLNSRELVLPLNASAHTLASTEADASSVQASPAN